MKSFLNWIFLKKDVSKIPQQEIDKHQYLIDQNTLICHKVIPKLDGQILGIIQGDGPLNKIEWIFKAPISTFFGNEHSRGYNIKELEYVLNLMKQLNGEITDNGN